MSGVGSKRPGKRTPGTGRTPRTAPVGTRGRSLPSHPRHLSSRQSRHRAARARPSVTGPPGNTGHPCASPTHACPHSVNTRTRTASTTVPRKAVPRTDVLRPAGSDDARPDPHITPSGAPPHGLGREPLPQVGSRPPAAATRPARLSAGLAPTPAQQTRFRTKTGSARKIAITMHVTECGNAPRNADPAFPAVTLRNARAIRVSRLPRRRRYARAPSMAPQVACGNDLRHYQNA